MNPGQRNSVALARQKKMEEIKKIENSEPGNIILTSGPPTDEEGNIVETVSSESHDDIGNSEIKVPEILPGTNEIPRNKPFFGDSIFLDSE